MNGSWVSEGAEDNNPERAPHVTAIVLAAGRGSRMKQTVPKQFLDLNGRPVVWYSLNAFENAPEVTDIVLVTGKEYALWCEDHFGGRSETGFSKIRAIAAGGEERYDSVIAGLQAISSSDAIKECDYVMIHDGARPAIDGALIARCLAGALIHGASAAGMPSKDTVKICAPDGKVLETPPRKNVWLVQTPQTFRYDLICEAYHRLRKDSPDGLKGITDDAMAAERAGYPVYMCEGAYTNIKITTPEDLLYAQRILSSSCVKI